MERFRRELAPEHHRHELDARQFGNRARSDEAPVAQHGDPVADRIDLIEEMGDEDDADAAALEIPQDLEKRLDLVRVEAGGRLVEDEHLGREIDGARDGDDLLDGHRIGAQGIGDVDIEAIACQKLRGTAAHLAGAHEAEAVRLTADEEVFRHRQVRQQVHLLIDGADAKRERVGRIARVDVLPVEANGAGIALEHARQHLDQRRLAGAVLAQQAVDLAAHAG